LRPGGLEVVPYTTVVLARHGQAEGGVADPGLTARGHDEAHALAKELVSPLQRAVQTAAPLCAELGLKPRLRDGLAEFDRRSHEYVLLSRLKADGDPRYEACVAGDLSAWGMDLATFRAEAADVFAEILDRYAGGRVFVVTHGGVLNVLLGSVLGLDRMWFFHPENAGISRVVADADGAVRLGSLNETRHLPAA
jgi:probable phosphoglycerate mutase